MCSDAASRTGLLAPVYDLLTAPLEKRALGRWRRRLWSDVQALPFRKDTFDWVAGTLVFCEVPDPVAGLREIQRVLRPGGLLVMLEHVRPSGWLGQAADAISIVSARLWGEHFNRDAEGYARAAGFEIDRREWLWRDAVVQLIARGR